MWKKTKDKIEIALCAAYFYGFCYPIMIVYGLIMMVVDWFDPVIEVELPDLETNDHIRTERKQLTRKWLGGNFGGSERISTKSCRTSVTNQWVGYNMTPAKKTPDTSSPGGLS